MTIATNLTIVLNAANPAALRAQASGALVANSLATCIETGGPGQALYSWAPGSTAADTGDANPSVRKPNDILPANPGRWVIRDWPDTSSTLGVHGELLFPVVINAAGPSALLVAEGWTIIGVTEVGGVRTAWLRKVVQV